MLKKKDKKNLYELIWSNFNDVLRLKKKKPRYKIYTICIGKKEK